MAFNTIKIKKYSDVVIEKAAAAATIYPGCLVALNSADAVAVHGTAGGNVVPLMVALEDELQGKGIDDAYATGAKVQVWIPNPGDVFYGILADGQTIVKGDVLESNGAGYLQKHAADVGDSTVGSVQRAIIGISLDTESSAAGSDDSDINFLSINRRICVLVG